MKIALLIALILVLGAGAYVATQCPCERTPGMWLSGDLQTALVDDWSFANDRSVAPLCQSEVRSWRPHSINLNCMADDEGRLFLSCAQCDGKTWSTMVLNNPEARIRIGERLFPVKVRRVTDEATLDLAWQARARKVGREPTPRPPHWWSFELVSSNS